MVLPAFPEHELFGTQLKRLPPEPWYWCAEEPTLLLTQPLLTPSSEDDQ